MSTNINLADADFEKEVIQSDLPVLIDFWAEWCGPCKMIAPVINELHSEMQGKIKIYKMDIEANPNTPSSLGVRAIPTMILFKNGKPVGTKMGFSPKASLKEWIESLI